MTIDREHIVRALGDVIDPELGMSVVELGLIYDVHAEGGRVAITMTMTAPGCPLHDTIADWVRQAVARIPGVESVAVAVTFEPPWTADRIGRDLPRVIQRRGNADCLDINPSGGKDYLGSGRPHGA